MAKQFAGSAKFQIPGGQATPAPPVGTSLGKYGINLGQFVQQFNERTKEAGGMMIPVVVTVYNDRSFEFITKSPPAAVLLKKAANIAKGDKVKVKEGNFESFEGEVNTIDEASGRVTVMINIFGRSTPVELEYWQIEAV